MQLSYTNKIEFWKISNAYHYFLFPRISKLFNNFLVLRTQYMESQKKKKKMLKLYIVLMLCTSESTKILKTNK